MINPLLTKEMQEVIMGADRPDGFIDQGIDWLLLSDLEFHRIIGYYDGWRLTKTGEIIYTFLTGEIL